MRRGWDGRGAVIKCRNLQNIKEFLFSSQREREERESGGTILLQ